MTDIEKADVLRKAADIMSTEWGSEPIDEMRDYADALDPPHRASPDYVEHMKREAAAIRERYTGVSEIERQLAKARAEAEYWRNMNDRLEREIRDLRREIAARREDKRMMLYSKNDLGQEESQ